MAEPKIEALYTLIKKWTAAEIMARLGAFESKRAVDFYQTMLSAENEIRELLYGTNDLFVLGVKWGMLKDERKLAEEAAKEKLERRAQKLREELATMGD